MVSVCYQSKAGTDQSVQCCALFPFYHLYLVTVVGGGGSYFYFSPAFVHILKWNEKYFDFFFLITVLFLFTIGDNVSCSLLEPSGI